MQKEVKMKNNSQNSFPSSFWIINNIIEHERRVNKKKYMKKKLFIFPFHKS